MRNPLPATLYVTFQDQSQYEVLQKVMNENKDIILNVQDISQIENIHEQEMRIVGIIKFSNFIQIVCWSLVLVLAAVILSFSIFFLRGIFTTFRSDIQVKKLLGASKSQIITPFLTIVLYGILGGFAISIILLVVSLFVFDYYMLPLFNFALIPLLLVQWKAVILVAIGEIILIIAPLMAISYHFISTLHKKLR